MRGKKAARAAPMLAWGGQQALLGGADVGAACQQVGRQTSWQRAQRVDLLVVWHAARCRSGAGRRLADQQRQRVFGLGALARQRQRGGARGFHQRFVGAQFEARGGTHFGALLRQFVGARTRFVGLLRQCVLFGVGALGVVGLRNLGDQRDLRGLLRFFGGQVGSQCGIVQTFDAAEEV